MNHNDSRQPRVVILGGGFGGLHAARALKHAPVQVTIVDRNNHLVFQPLLYQVATAALESPDVAYPLRSLLRRQKNATVIMDAAQSVDVAKSEVHLAGGHTLSYDYLIFAAGAESFYFGHSEYRPYAPGLKSVADALEVRYRVLTAFERAEQESDPVAQRELLTFVVVGGGPTGVELAGALADLSRHALKRDFRHIDPTQARVILVEGGPHILPTYPPDLQAKAIRQLASLGVDVRTSSAVHGIDERGVSFGTERIDARTVLWGAGTTGTPLARTLGVELDRKGRFPVTATLNVAGLPNVFAIGDAAVVTQDGRPVPGVAPAAIQGGHYAARAIIAQLGGRPTKPFRYWNKGELATIGRSRAVAMLPGNVKLSGFLAQLFYLTVHLLYLSGFGTRVRVFFSWAWSYVTFSRGARLIPSRLPAEFTARPKAPSLPPPQLEPHPPTPQTH
jgi:NADH dehydrogenase